MKNKYISFPLKEVYKNENNFLNKYEINGYEYCILGTVFFVFGLIIGSML
jgi:hypothetical protein